MNEKITKVLDEIWKLDLEQQKAEEEHGDKHFDFSDRVISVGPDTGNFLYILARLSQAKIILDVGTSYGYSGLWLGAAALENGGKVYTFDVEPKKIAIAKSNFKKAGLEKIITQVEGDFVEEVRKMPDMKVDMVLIDALKEDYPKYFDAVFSYMMKGSMIVADNMEYPPHFKEAANVYRRHIKKRQVITQSIPNLGWGLELTIKDGE